MIQALRALLIAGALLASQSVSSARAQQAAGSADEPGSAPHYVILIHRFGSASLTGPAPDASDPDNHQVRDDFAPLRERLATDLAETRS